MGSNRPYPDEQPVHTVNLSAFWIDRNDVTVDQYAACVTAGGCTAPRGSNSSFTYCNWGSPRTGDHPINCVDWSQGRAYCTWAGKRYPTEAEWEKAARGTDARTFPWGDAEPSCTYAVTRDAPSVEGNGCGVWTTAPVGSKPAGASPYGALDMLGNVWQWVNDWYDPSYYATSPSTNPPGPASSPGGARVLRGNPWSYWTYYVPDRDFADPTFWDDGAGFRCAKDDG